MARKEVEGVVLHRTPPIMRRPRFSFAFSAIVLAGLACLLAPGTRAQTPEPRLTQATRVNTSQPLREVPVRPGRYRVGPPFVVPNKVHRFGTRSVATDVPPGFRDPVLDEALWRGSGETETVAIARENFGGVSATIFAPPDVNGDVGPGHYMQSTNTRTSVYRKTGSIQLQVPNNHFFAGLGGPCEEQNDGDPVVLYDHLADRWVIMQFQISAGFDLCIAVSATPDPTGSYHQYEFDFTEFPDYPKLGVWPDAYYATNQSFAGSTLNQEAIAFERDAMLQGLPAQMVVFTIPESEDLVGMLPADLDGPAPPPGAPGLFAAIPFMAPAGPEREHLRLYEMAVDWTTPANSTFTLIDSLATAAFVPPPQAYVPQPGVTDFQLESLGDRLMFQLQYRNFGSYQTLLANHTVQVDAGTADERAGVRWYEVRNAGSRTGGGWGFHQQATYAPDDDLYRWMGSMAMNGLGDIALGYSVASEDLFPSIWVTGQTATMSGTGIMNVPELEVQAGTGAQLLFPRNRWGDYTMMTVDPVNDETFWYTNQYLADFSVGADWLTRIAAFDVADTPLVPDLASSEAITDLGAGAVAWADYDTDGDPDLVLVGTGRFSNGSNDFGELYRNDGGTLVLDAAASDVVPGVEEGDVAWADYDSDGDPDLVVIGEFPLPIGRIGELYRNDGGTLVLDAAASDSIPGLSFGAIAWADYDGDDDPDLVVTGRDSNGDNRGELYRNDVGVLVRDAAASSVIADVRRSAVAWGDYDADGDSDLMVTGTGNGPTFGELYRNDGGVLVRDVAASAVIPNVDSGSIAWADYDGDDDLDLLVTGSSFGTLFGDVYRNDAGVFVRDAAASDVVADVESGAVAWADYDSDGDPDLVVTGEDASGDPVGEVYRNDGGVLVRDAGASTAVLDMRESAVAWADVDGDGDPDLAVTGINQLESFAAKWGGDVYRSVGSATPPPNFDLTAINTDPAGSPIVVSQGGQIAFDYTVTNNTAAPASGDFWFTASLGGTTVAQGVIQSGTLPAGGTFSPSFVQPIPSGAPTTTYAYTLHIGLFPNVSVDEVAFEVEVTEVGRAGGSESWAVTEADPWTELPASASAASPSAAMLHPVYPNPFADQATLGFDVPEVANVRLVVYDVLGRAVVRLVDGEVEAGRHTVVLDGAGLPSGVYLIRLTTATGFAATQRVTLLR